MAAGELFVLMGLSGSGKSTLPHILHHLVEPTPGELRIEGRDVLARAGTGLRELRMTFQHRTVRENAPTG